jgi:DMSO reductase anchor subunit
MRPAFSVLFLTTLIGVGQGLLIAMVAGQFYFVIGAPDLKASGGYYAFGSLIALGFLAAGLLASFFHLSHPERGMRAITRWRTSWLSREVILLPLVMGAAFLYGVLHFFDFSPVLLTFGNRKALDLAMAAGFVAGGLSGLLFITTGMIYACVRFIPQWASFWTVGNYLFMGLASGFTLAAVYSGMMKSPFTSFMVIAALGLTLLAGGCRLWSFIRNAKMKNAVTLKSAIGHHHDRIRQISRGFMGGSFNIEEFFHPGKPEMVGRLAYLSLILAFGLPAGLLASAWLGGGVAVLAAAFVIQYLGLFIERWVFFAEGRHIQNIYYQGMA